MGGPRILNLPTLGPRTPQGVEFEVNAIEEMSDDDLRDWLVDREQDVGDGSRAVMVGAARHWRGLGAAGDASHEDEGVVLPEARAWISDSRKGLAAAAAAKERAAAARYAALEPTAFDPGRVCAGSPGLAATPTLMCARCKATWYSSREAQRAHWRLHKKTCRALSDAETAAIAGASLGEVRARIARQLHGDFDATLRPWIERLRELLDGGADEDGNAEMEIHTLARSLIFHGDDGYFDALWAAPGMASLLATGDWLLNDAERKVKRAFPDGLPTDEAVDAMDGDDKVVGEILLERDGGGGRTGAYKFCYFYFNLVVASAVHAGPTMSSAHDGRGRLRNGAVSEVALARALDLWSCPLVRECCGDALAPGCSLALTAADAGLGGSGARLVRAALDELEWSAGQSYANSLLAALAAPKKKVEAFGDARARARAAVALVEYALEKRLVRTGKDGSAGNDPYASKPADPDVVLALLAKCLDGREPERAGIRERVLKIAAGDERAVGAPGRTDAARAFFFWLRARVEAKTRPRVDAAVAAASLPEDVTRHIVHHAADSREVDVAAELAHYENACAEDDPARVDARRRAVGPRRYAARMETKAELARTREARA